MINFPYKCLNHFRKACLEDYTHTFVDHIIDIMEGREVPEDEKARVYTIYILSKKEHKGAEKKINKFNKPERNSGNKKEKV